MSVYMKIDGINGKVTAKGHEQWIDCSSLQWGVGRAISSAVGTSADREASKPSISEVSITKMMDGMEKENVLIGRPFPPFTKWARISSCTIEDIKRFDKALRKVMT